MTQDVEARRIVSPGFRRTLTLAGLVCGLFAGMAPMGAYAQQTVFVGKGQPNDVIIDLSVLDKLGPPPRLSTSPRRNARRAASTEEANPFVVLTPPPAPPPSQKTASTSAPSSTRATMPLVPTPAPQAAAQAPSPAPAAPATASPMATTSSAPPATASTPEPKPAETAAATPPAPAPAAPSPSVAPASTPPAAQEPAPAPASPPSQPAPAASASPAPTPSPEPAAAPPSQMAAVPPPAAAGKSVQAGQALSVNFGSGSSDLSDSAKGSLDKAIGTMKQDAEARLQLLAYAAGTDDQASQARRLSLTRALAVRTYLIDKGIASTRIDVRALGNKVEGGGPADRVDLVFINNK